MASSSEPNQPNDEYANLARYTEIRTREISGLLGSYITITDRYGRLIARLTVILGLIKPRDTQDMVVRDLMADIFDCLHEARVLILSGKCTVAYPIARRAYESLSLLHLCTLDAEWVERWERGEKISNGQVRKRLNRHRMGEPEDRMKELYTFFCAATHPNRNLIPYGLLGEGNRFVLGAIGKPDLIMVADYAMKHLGMWTWLTATVSYFYREDIAQRNMDYLADYMEAHEEAQTVMKELAENYNRLLADRKTQGPPC
jgi:hypothetical protein